MDKLFLNELRSCKEEIDRAVQQDSFLSEMTPNDCTTLIPSYLRAFQQFTNGGKRIRAYLVKLGYEMTAGKPNPKILLPALSYEVFQSGILIHDDIIDESDTRRGMPAMHVTLGDGQIGRSKAICVGDIGLFAAVDLVARADFDPQLVLRAVRHQVKVFEYTGAGEIKDIELAELDRAWEDRILRMYMLKTSWYTIIGPLQLGAILAGADEEFLRKIEKIGLAMGIAFQIMDDVIGIFGKSDVIGKSNLSDMQEGKQTVLAAHFAEHATRAQTEEFRRYYGVRASGAEALQAVQALFRAVGSYDYAMNLCRDYAERAGAGITELPVAEEYRQILRSFLDYLCSRSV